MRVLGRIRLSRATEESTSPERQREIIQRWADDNEHTIIGWAEDLDISGSVDPFDTPALGPWLADERLHEWDILCSWKLDRLARRAIPLHRLFGLCMDNDKTLVCIADNIDLSSWVGRLVASVIAGVAEGELEAIRERTRSSQKKLRELGRWGGGKPIYGYRAQKREDAAGWQLVPDEGASRVLREVIEKVLAGQSTESIARELTKAGELTPADYLRQRAGKPTRGHSWSNAGLRQLLRSKTLLGHATHNGTTVRDADGAPVLTGEPLITQDVFDRVQAALDSRGFKVTNRSAKASPLLGVAICGMCGRLMHLRQHHSKERAKTYRYYQCLGGGTAGGGGATREHPTNVIKADELEELVEEGFLSAYGAEGVKERVFIPAENHQNELDEAVRATEELTGLLGTITSTTMKSKILGQLAAIDSRIATLEKLPSSEARWEWRSTDELYADAWANADIEARRQLLLGRKVSVRVAVRGRVARQTPGVLEFDLVADDVA